jgi:hypothetical protein
MNRENPIHTTTFEVWRICPNRLLNHGPVPGKMKKTWARQEENDGDYLEQYRASFQG